MGMVPSYKNNEWQVIEDRRKHSVILIRVPEGGEFRDYWVPTDPANTDYTQYLEWLAEGNEPRIVL